MNILFTGPVGLIREWVEACSGHQCVVYGRGLKKEIEADVQIVRALDEAPHIDLIIDLHVRMSKKRRLILGDLLAEVSEEAPLLCNASAITATELTARVGGADRIVGIAALPGLIESDYVEMCFPYGAKHGHQEILTDFFAALGKHMKLVRDEVGMITPRILAVTINEAVTVVQQDLTGRETVDELLRVAMLGNGPLHWGHRIGWRNLYTILSAMYEELGGERYRPASLLKKMALSE